MISLAQWFHLQKGRPLSQIKDPDLLLLAVAAHLYPESNIGIEAPLLAIEEFVKRSCHHTECFNQCETILCKEELSFLEWLSTYFESALGMVSDDRLMTASSTLADRMEPIAFRFLAAWVALNCGQYQRCIEECDKVDYPFAALHTIQGQALLESGKVEAAIEVLNIAVKLSPSEALAWFQLAKAYFSIQESSQSWWALGECERTTGRNIEIATMRALITLDDPTALAQYGREAFKGLAQFASSHSNASISFELGSLLVRLMTELGDRKLFPDTLDILKKIPYDHSESHAKLVAQWSGLLHGKGWYAEAVVFLDCLAQPYMAAPEGKANSSSLS